MSNLLNVPPFMITTKSYLKQLFSKKQKPTKVGEPITKPDYHELPVFEVAYPNNTIQLQNIAPYDEEIKVLISKYFPGGLSNAAVKPGQRPRSLSLQPTYPGNIVWNKNKGRSGQAGYAMAISLYEDGEVPGSYVGDPIADCCAVISTRNYVVMVCADGCGWGEAASTAARIAVLKMLSALTQNVFQDVYTSQDVFEKLNSGLETVQSELIKSGGAGLTTICATVVAPLRCHTDFSPDAEHQWVVCNVRVGDTATYRYCTKSKKLNLLSHQYSSDARDMKNCGGCLGPVVGSQPDLENLEFSISLADDTSIVFLATDGVGDNFNPYVTNQLSGKDRKCHDLDLSDSCSSLLHKVYCSCVDDSDGLGGSCDLEDLPKHRDLTISPEDEVLHAEKCHLCNSSKQSAMVNLLKPSDLCPVWVDILSLKYFQELINSVYVFEPSVEELVISICNILVKSTDRKRTAMERFNRRYSELSSDEAETVSRSHRGYLKTIPGKLDHASIVAVNLGKIRELDSHCLKSTEPSSTKELIRSNISPANPNGFSVSTIIRVNEFQDIDLSSSTS